MNIRRMKMAAANLASEPDFAAVGGAWTTQGSWSAASAGVAAPNGSNVEAYFNMGAAGDLELQWEYSALLSSGTSTALEFGFAPSANVANMFSSRTLSSGVTGSFFVADNPAGNNYRAYHQGSLVWTSPGSRSLSDVFRLTRDGTQVRLYLNDVLVHTYSQTSTGALAAAARANAPGTSADNIVFREFARA